MMYHATSAIVSVLIIISQPLIKFFALVFEAFVKSRLVGFERFPRGDFHAQRFSVQTFELLSFKRRGRISALTIFLVQNIQSRAREIFAFRD